MLIHWIAIILLILIGIYLVKMDHHARKIKIVLIIIVGLLLYFSIMGVFKSEQVDVTSPKGIVGAVYVYFGWIGQTMSNLWDIGGDTVNLVGNAIKTNNTEENPRR